MFKYTTRLKKSYVTASKGWLKAFTDIEIKNAIRTGIASALSLFVGVWFSKLLNRPDYLISGLWCVVSTIVVLQAHLGGTYKASWQRFLGVIIGSVSGCVLTYYLGSNPVSLGIAVAVTVIICSFLRMQESVRIACLTVAVILVLSGLRQDLDIWWFGIYRFLDSCLGICIAVVVAHTLWPAEATEKIEHNITKIFSSLSKLFHLSADLEVESERHEKLFYTLKDEIDELLEDNNERLDEARLELAMRHTSLDSWKQLLISLRSSLDAIITIKQLPKSKLILILDESLLTKLQDFSEETEASLQRLSGMFEIEENGAVKDQDLTVAYNALKEDLVRFRGTRATRQFDWKEIEGFFVYFYSLGMVAEEIFHMEELLPKLHSD
jgi:uncharacterized membrane protein YgaE (UPF0421/DUF939 family)